MDNILSFSDLYIYQKRIGEPPVKLIHGISTSFKKGEITGIIGESGSGKSITMKAVMDLLPENLIAELKDFYFDGKESIDDRNTLPIAMIFQNSIQSLDPLRTVEFHMKEVIRRFYPKLSKGEIREKMIATLRDVGLYRAENVLRLYPHELSGGMAQRVMISLAMLTEPKLLIADEPTTALDVTTQAQILDLIKNKSIENNLTVIFVTHDLAIISEVCSSVKVMYEGLIVEEAPTDTLFNNPEHWYTKNLIQAYPHSKNRERLFTISKLVEADFDKEADLKLVEIAEGHKVLRGDNYGQ